MRKYLSTLAWRYVFWRAENDYRIYILKAIAPVVVACMLLAYVCCSAAGLSRHLTVLAVASVQLLAEFGYGDAVEPRLRAAYRPRYRMSYDFRFMERGLGGA